MMQSVPRLGRKPVLCSTLHLTFINEQRAKEDTKVIITLWSETEVFIVQKNDSSTSFFDREQRSERDPRSVLVVLVVVVVETLRIKTVKKLMFTNKCPLMFTNAHKCHQCSLVSTSVHQCTQVFTSVHKCSLVYTSVHQCPQVFTSVH